MIDQDAFTSAWRRLLVRFGKPFDAEQAAMYYDYLAELQTTDEFLRSCHAVWATAKWFPRPADFLTVSAAGDWPIVLKCAEGFHPPDWPWAEHWKRLSPRSQAAVRRLGGVDHVKEQLARSSLKIREAFFTAYEEEATAEALALPAAPNAPRLSA